MTTTPETVETIRASEALMGQAPQVRERKVREEARAALDTIATDTPPSAPDIRGLMPEDAIRALEAYYVAALRFGGAVFPASLDKAREYAAECWSGALPNLVDRLSVVQFLACVASGAKLKIITGQEAKMYVFLAQTQLTVLKLMVEVEETSKRVALPPSPPAPQLFAPMPQNAMEPTPAQQKAGKR